MKNMVKLVLDLSQIQEDPNLAEKLCMEEKPLKVAAVRNRKVLASFELDVREIEDFSNIPVDVEFEYPGEEPPGVYITVGPNVDEMDFLGLETRKLWVPPQKFKKFTADLRRAPKYKLAIPAYLFRRWLLLCRTFTITGKVVRRVETESGYCDAPVPGAIVHAFDVDCWWFWWKRDKVGTTITRPDGTFEIKFKWCCNLWYPPLKPIWAINPDLLKYFTEAAKPIVGPIPREALKSPVHFEEFLERVSTSPIPLPSPKSREPATERFMVSSSPETSEYAAGFSKPAVGTLKDSMMIKELIPKLKLIYPPFPCWPLKSKDCSPDIIFLVQQECGGAVNAVIYEDVFDARWNIPTSLNVTLFANEKACFIPCEELPPGDCLKFNWVNCYRVDKIGTNSGPPDLRGYYDPGDGDNPFAGIIRVRGLFGAGSDVDYFKVQYCYNGGPFKDMPEDKLVGFSRAYYAPPPGAGPIMIAKYNSVPFNPQLVDGKIVYKTIKKAEEENPLPAGWTWGYLWNDVDTLFRWNSSGFPEGDGLYTLRLVGYEWNDKTKKLVNEQVMKTCALQLSKEERVMIRIDNRDADDPIYASTEGRPCGTGTIHLCTYEPDCDFTAVDHLKIGDDKRGILLTSVGPCDIIELSDDDKVVIHFNASDKDGHLLGYQMTAHWGENKVFNVLANGILDSDPDKLVGPTYNQTFGGDQGVHRSTLPPTDPEHDRPCWKGGNYKVTVKGDKFSTCAYTLRLRVWKRTREHCTDPYHVHVNWCSLSFTIKKV